jgi:mannose-6-phosphate isomerase-like protein (cupin superfamily)
VRAASSLDGQAAIVRERDVEPESWSDPARGDVTFRTIFGTEVRTPEFTLGVTELDVGGWLGHHPHEPAEVYYVLSGEGVVSIEGREHPVGPETAVYIPGNTEHAIRNTGDRPLRFVHTFAAGSMDEIEYRFTAEG